MGTLDRDRDGSQPFLPPPPPPPLGPSEERPYHAKRPHRKSRLGCRNCKARKVKCDEAKPSCRNCTLRKDTCNYPASQNSAPAGPAQRSSSGTGAAPPVPAPIPPSTSASATSNSVPFSYGSPLSVRTAASPAVSSISALPAHNYSPGPPTDSRRGSQDDASNSSGSTELIIVDEPPVKLAGADEYDMKLLWFYSTETYASFAIEAGRIPFIDRILKSHIIQFAFQSPFLMDCILGLSALHMQSLHMTVPVSKAIMYRARAFSGYRKAIERADPKDFPALLSCSLLLCMLSSEAFREPDMKPLYIIDWMVLWRGIGLIMELIPIDTIVSSGLEKLFSRPAFNLNQTALHIPNNLFFMITSIKEDDEDYPYVEAYYNTLKFLGGLYLELETGFSPILSMRIITWFTFLPKPFIELGRKRRPRALVILAHYVAFLKMVEGVWWMLGIGDRSIQEIIDYLGPEWQSLLSVPRAAMSIHDKVELAKLIRGNHAWEPAEVDQIVQHPNPYLRTLTMVNNQGEAVAYDKEKGWVPAASNPEPQDPGSPEYLTPPYI
ncbi:hypothetical protein J7T55_006846 [Diaporthe amygdali]|uniref:uncharacterized protein n=1 Tax=Phomopsis amygdali TaxID=1214568 RepID=UPI0022FE43F6|nr:uncharacterized protein J7T55_006846 [Diaporthe amygdali]KAJ0125497.1 hypothetical protein J7T55_006846 [Diaporthe amygdali]